MPGHGVWALKQGDGISNLNLGNSIPASVCRTCRRGKTGGKETSEEAVSVLVGVITAPWMEGGNGVEEGHWCESSWGFVWASSVIDSTGQRGRQGRHWCLT